MQDVASIVFDDDEGSCLGFYGAETSENLFCAGRGKYCACDCGGEHSCSYVSGVGLCQPLLEIKGYWFMTTATSTLALLIVGYTSGNELNFTLFGRSQDNWALMFVRERWKCLFHVR